MAGMVDGWAKGWASDRAAVGWIGGGRGIGRGAAVFATEDGGELTGGSNRPRRTITSSRQGPRRPHRCEPAGRRVVVGSHSGR
jgi:hypothetical protein